MCECTKSAVRARILEARRTVGPDARAHADAILVQAAVTRVREHVKRSEPTITAYVPLSGEPGGSGLVDALAAVTDRCRLLLPILLTDGDLTWAEYRGQSSLRRAARGLLEPAGPRLGAEAITTADVIVVPAVAVDQTGIRLGRGGGSYDRALARVSPEVDIITLLYASEFVPRLPSLPHDRPVTHAMIATGSAVSTVHFPAR
ncbi:MAG: 5-formyltetrahydrofolate cyclo-ligase [Micromonosporaceae bacterium]|nr:5-formyltetrahydrofolate cyclo-ligase [Micromonosporaceae bacterium]